MSINLPGYKLIEALHEGVNTVIYRGQRELEETSVIIKTLKAEYPTLEQIIRLRHEYKITEKLQIEGIIKSYRLEQCKNSLALILEDFGGVSLKEIILTEPLKIIDFFKIAIQLSKTLGDLHQEKIIHKDIKTSNIIINPETLKVRLTDFSISSRLFRETQTISNPTLIEGTLAYMSPEQTGRMNRSIDYRTDFYSLGITFYELLTGQLPFTSTDPMELVHCHIAKIPVPPHYLNPDIPAAVSSIVMKLLAKTAEERYQSAYGLKADLEECLKKLQASGKIENFIPGKLDRSGQFLIPQKLYGRESEVETLMSAFDRVAEATSEMMLVSGYSGIGKSCLVHEIHKPIVRQRGYFISGKFDQFKRNIPYAALIQAFQELIRQLLTENSEKITVWKEKITKALGENGRVITDVIPEVELIIGEQPAILELGPTESQNRFNRVFQQFIHVFTKKEHPLALFLDDLQWADAASLKLIQLLITDPDSCYLLLIGAYRDNEVSPTHPTILVLEEIKKAGSIVNNIILRPLDIDCVSQLVADALQETGRINEIVELVFNKTQGNPFFLTQLLQTLYSEKLLHFDFNEGRWLWDIEQIQAIGITDYNVVELVARNIQKLSEETINVLKLAACIGNQFNLDVLAVVSEESLLNTANNLWEALQMGLILPINNAYKIPLFFDQSEQGSLLIEELRIGYKFLHDRVQQAAYSLIPDDRKKTTHLNIGQLLLEKTAKYGLEDNIFDIVNQLNMGLELITTPAKKYELANLNLIAGQKAKAATAYDASVKYLTVGLELLPEENWQSDYDLTLELYLETIEAEYLNINFVRAATLAEVARENAQTLLEQVKVYEAQMLIYIGQLEMLKAVDTGLQVLENLGVSLLTLKNNESWVIDLPELADLENSLEMTDPNKLAAMRILKILCAPVFQAKPEIFPQLILTMVNLCIEYGNSPLSAFAYGFYGLLLSGTGNLDAGYHAGQLALKLLEKFNAKELKAKVYNLFNSNIRTWKEHAKNSVIPLKEGVQSGLETGDIEWGGYCSANLCSYLFFTEQSLDAAVQQQALYIDIAVKIKQEIPIHFSSVWRQLGLNLQGLSSDVYLLVGESFDELEMLPRLTEAKTGTVLFVFYVAKTILAYHFKKYEESLKYAALAEEQVGSAFGFMQVAVLNFYHSLALLALYAQVNLDEQQKCLEQVNANQEKMKHWAVHAPSNFQHKYDLVEAEKARVLKQNFVAMELYDQAINEAKEQGYLQEEALANELTAEFYFKRNKEKIAQAYMTEAYYTYIRWGAVAKVQDLDERYPQLIFRTPRLVPNLDTTRTTIATTTGESSAVMDLVSVMKASQAISGEIVLNSLLEKLIKIVIENAGAQRGCLLNKKDNCWTIAVEGTVTDDEVTLSQFISDEASYNLPISIINYVERTKKNLVIDNAAQAHTFTDPYLLTNQPQSILCLPIIHQGKLSEILYLENNLTTGAFTSERLKVLNLLTAQISISIENARLYTNLQTYSQELELKNIALQESETREREKAHALEQSLYKLQQTQAQLVQTEKISSLGQLVAGVAHEVNNPVSFISGNLSHATQYVQDLLNLVNLYQEMYPNPTPEIRDEIEAIELDYLIEDLPKLLSSMQVGTDRIRDIMQSLRSFSRVDGSQKKTADIHAGIESTLMILQHRLKAKPERPAIQVIKEYSKLPLVECYAGQLNQVFMNLLANAIDALEGLESYKAENWKDSPKFSSSTPTILIRTEVVQDNKVAVRITDNGLGMTEEIRQQLFAPFFTTKPVGKGTGLGLSISHQIVVEKHEGSLRCISEPGKGTEFVVEIPIKSESEV